MEDILNFRTQKAREDYNKAYDKVLRLMKKFITDNGLYRREVSYREIYLNVRGKIAPDKQKTILKYTI